MTVSRRREEIIIIAHDAIKHIALEIDSRIDNPARAFAGA